MNEQWMNVLEEIKKDTQTYGETINIKEKPVKTEEEEEWISLMMDGRVFTTTKETLMSDKESIFNYMFSKDSLLKLSRDESHPLKPYLFDRNPIYFEPILNYLRNGKLILNENVNPMGVLLEAKYFNIKFICEELGKMIKEKQSEKNQSELSREFIIKALITCPSGSANLRFQGLSLSGLDLSGLDLSGINFQRSNLKGANLSNCTLNKADFTHCNLTNTDFSNASCLDVKFTKADLKNSLFIGSKLKNSDFQQSDLTESCLRSSDLTDVNMSFSILVNCDLSFANLKGAKLTRAITTGIKRQGANLSMGGVVG